MKLLLLSSKFSFHCTYSKKSWKDGRFSCELIPSLKQISGRKLKTWVSHSNIDDNHKWSGIQAVLFGMDSYQCSGEACCLSCSLWSSKQRQLGPPELIRHILQHFDHLQHGLTVERFQLHEDRPTLSFEFTKYKELQSKTKRWRLIYTCFWNRKI
jgi:hypothetical protein